jgi:hypothetical protein
MSARNERPIHRVRLQFDWVQFEGLARKPPAIDKVVFATTSALASMCGLDNPTRAGMHLTKMPVKRAWVHVERELSYVGNGSMKVGEVAL